MTLYTQVMKLERLRPLYTKESKYFAKELNNARRSEEANKEKKKKHVHTLKQTKGMRFE